MPMITCSDCNKEMSDAAPACPNCGKPNIKPTQSGNERPVSILLGIGIFLIPIIFAWFTLRKGHTTRARIITFIWLIFTLAIYGSADKETTTTAQTQATQPAAKAVKQEPEAIKINASKILSDYRNNEVQADNVYKGKYVEVTGWVGEIKKDLFGSLYITVGTGAEFEIPQVQAFFDDSMNNKLATLNKGARVTIVCKVEGLMMNVIAKKCVLK